MLQLPHGFMSWPPRFLKSDRFRVTTVIPSRRAVAAISASRSERENQKRERIYLSYIREAADEDRGEARFFFAHV